MRYSWFNPLYKNHIIIIIILYVVYTIQAVLLSLDPPVFIEISQTHYMKKTRTISYSRTNKNLSY